MSTPVINPFERAWEAIVSGLVWLIVRVIVPALRLAAGLTLVYWGIRLALFIGQQIFDKDTALKAFFS